MCSNGARLETEERGWDLEWTQPEVLDQNKIIGGVNTQEQVYLNGTTLL